ncbi:MAG: sugar phosphate isomerase/epimerase [Spirochaetales bacterium]|nr:sugar phosphate isomerase/epimerase [Spirochaetales bacterium]
MNVSLYSKTFQYFHFTDILPIAKKYGYSGIEFDRLPKMGASLLQEYTAKEGMDIVAIHSAAHVMQGSNIASGNADKRFAGTNAILEAIDYAGTCGCPVVQVKGMYCWPYSSPYKGFWERAKKELQHISKIAEAKNVKLALQVKHTIAYLINSPWAAIEMIEEVGSPALGVTFDTGIFNLMTLQATSLVGFINILKDHIIHVQVNDNDGTTDQKLPPGRGNINWDVLLMALRDINYSGYLSVDLENGFEQRDPHGASWESIQFLKEKLSAIN